VDGPRDASGRPRKPTTRRSVYPLIPNRASLRQEWRRCRVGGSRRRQRQLSVGSSKILSSRPPAQPFRHGTQASETASRGCFVRYWSWEFTQYDQAEFTEVCREVLPRDHDVSEDLARYIAGEVYSTLGSTQVREATRIGRLADTTDEVDELIASIK
jgi:hypothetical protein